jgi:ABC-2 type transport system ATP-binding protein
MILAENLTKSFGDFKAVDAVDLNIQPGEVLALLGPNGAGKTTTLRMLSSLLIPSDGWAKVANFDIVRQADRVRASVGVLTENHGLYNRMPAADYLDFFGRLYQLPRKDREEQIKSLLTHFGLADHMRQPLGEFSKGMRQKLALARSLLHNPPVLLLDEPTSAMDPESARLVRDAIRTLRSQDRTIVVCTHNLAEAEELADKIAIIRQGKIILQGSPLELKNNTLGLPEYEIRLAIQLNGRRPSLPEGLQQTSSGQDWIRYRTPNPLQDNPQILQLLVEQDLPVFSLQEVSRSLEQVYLQVISNPEKERTRNAG